jgi:hypothetical protein
MLTSLRRSVAVLPYQWMMLLSRTRSDTAAHILPTGALRQFCAIRPKEKARQSQ